MLRRKCLCGALAVLLALPILGRGPAGASEFVAGIADLPLMPGFRELPGEGLLFDKPGGRIVEAYAEGEDQPRQRVMDFYNQTLPQLGWRRAGDLVFVREAEELKLTLSEEGGRLIIRFDIAPR
ncbi:MAG: hypothetical protein KIT20_10375 [Alphaproteobacteria bacterium]|nr:hypothetical protein [Alphaproteobacteria bacterium]